MSVGLNVYLYFYQRISLTAEATLFSMICNFSKILGRFISFLGGGYQIFVVFAVALQYIIKKAQSHSMTYLKIFQNGELNQFFNMNISTSKSKTVLICQIILKICSYNDMIHFCGSNRTPGLYGSNTRRRTNLINTFLQQSYSLIYICWYLYM